jgi:hypothetical protein
MIATLVRTAALGAVVVLTGCRAIQGLGGLTFDVVDGGDGRDGGGSGGGGGGAAGVEDCTNGQDDDGDTLIDCADPDCGAVGYACVAAPPSGWTGPVALHEAPFADAVPACAGRYPDVEYQGDTGPAAPAATCDECACAAAEITCSVVVGLFSNGSCKGGGTKSSPLVPGTCMKLDASASSLRLEMPTSTIMDCAPSGGKASVPALVRSTRGVVCGAMPRSGGCQTDEICAPLPAAPFQAARCISTKGATSCPSSYPDPHHLETVSDDRGCSPCACGAPAPASCAATTTLFGDDACSAQIASLPNDDSCVTSMPSSAIAAIVGGGTASCQPSGGTPTGAVTAVSQTGADPTLLRSSA